ncbi:MULTISPECIES: LacI family DNA-binding transcriptional regulator [unclassified Arthrobacter]|uniref:LacI family DNA-binding transcriptional regulator n=1 Tax=unclassified Arthrobacter TaxID=235627 RepID=UPI0015E44BC1|nr:MULTISPECIES: LacI family DNA-binding transcriptional regulator [unclassified Arthrobacter]
MAGIEQHRVTVKDVAVLAGVSTATVTRVLQDSEKVIPETRDRVMAAVEQLGYRPNPMARDLRHGNRTGAVGLVMSTFTNMYQAGVAAGAEKELRNAGLQLLIGSTDEDPSREPELARAMIDRRVSALMVMPDGEEREFLNPGHLFGTPVILVGRPAGGLDADVVMTDDDRGVEEATNQLLDLGHRRIAALAGQSSSFRATQRLSGYRMALAKRGLGEDPELVVDNLITSAQARSAMAHLMDLPSPPTAVLALNLGISTGVLLDRLENNRKLAFIALDESELSAGLSVSALVRDPEEVGRQAAKLAIDRIAQPDLPARTIILPSHLVQRGTGEVAPEIVSERFEMAQPPQ